MTIELLKANIEKEKEIVNELNTLYTQLGQVEQEQAIEEISLIQDSIKNLLKQLNIVNDAIPDIANNIKFYKELKEQSPIVKPISKVSYITPEKQNIELGIKKKDQVSFLETVTKKELESKKIEKKAAERRASALQGMGFFIRLSNKYFRNFSDKLIEEKYFENLNKDLRKISSPFIIQSYVSMMFMSTFLSFILAILIFIPVIIFGSPLLSIFILFGLPFATFFFFFLYPSSERKNLEKEINQELPFVTIYMSSVATSGIEPTKIFSILVRTKDYPFTQREVKKLLNYINFYGYDLVSALRHSSKTSPSERLAMLFNGFATTIRSGGELNDFLNKHAEGLLFDYRLEREKYTKVAETFMDIYISILIAAPMIMMILFILLSLTGYAGSFLNATFLTVAIVSVISILNIGFLIFLNMKQPKF